MAFTHVIKYEGDNSILIKKYPRQDFNMGSQLIVHESQKAIFVVNGEILDIFGAGRHILETENLPLIRSVLKLATGGKNPFHAELYFVNQTEHMALRWGTDQKFMYMEPEYHFPIELGACGEMSLSVSNGAKLLGKLVGTEDELTSEELSDYFRSFILNRIKSMIPAAITEQKISIFDVDTHLSELSDMLKLKLADDFYDYGITLDTFFIMTILKPDDDKNFIHFKDLHYRKYSAVAEAELKQRLELIEKDTEQQKMRMEAEAQAKKRQIEGYTWQQEKSFEVARDMAQNEAVGQMNNVGVGLGMMTGIGGEVGQAVGTMTSSAIQNMRQASPDSIQKDTAGALLPFCPECGYQFSGNEKFCPNCGVRRGNS